MALGALGNAYVLSNEGGRQLVDIEASGSAPVAKPGFRSSRPGNRDSLGRSLSACRYWLSAPDSLTVPDRARTHYSLFALADLGDSKYEPLRLRHAVLARLAEFERSHLARRPTHRACAQRVTVYERRVQRALDGFDGLGDCQAQ
jgi:hypothetical protein